MKTRPMKPTDLYFDGDMILSCPRCGEQNLHSRDVTIWDRGEDATRGLQVVFDEAEQNVSVGTNLTDNPSFRRHAVSIDFACEGCCNEVFEDKSRYMRLNIVQHKGSTYLSWRMPE